jgi:hypothetical protein
MDRDELGFEERCLNFIWEDTTKRIIFYPHLRLIAWRGLLVRHIVLGDLAEIEFDKFNASTEFRVCWRRSSQEFCFDMNGLHNGSNWRVLMGIDEMIGMRSVRTIQRQWLCAFQKRRGDRALALMMATHRRLGAASQLSMLESSVLQMCVEK